MWPYYIPLEAGRGQDLEGGHGVGVGHEVGVGQDGVLRVTGRDLEDLAHGVSQGRVAVADQGRAQVQGQGHHQDLGQDQDREEDQDGDKDVKLFFSLSSSCVILF